VRRVLWIVSEVVLALAIAFVAWIWSVSVLVCLVQIGYERCPRLRNRFGAYEEQSQVGMMVLQRLESSCSVQSNCLLSAKIHQYLYPSLLL
jgi:hypothetical protein